MQKDISPAVIRRLPRYYRYLNDLKESGVERISSGELSARMRVTASQIRQDLNNFGEFGQQGYGYNVSYLRDEIRKILGVDRNNNMIIVGAGHLGQALANYDGFAERGFQIKALFDADQEKIGMKIRGIPVYDIKELDRFLQENRIEIAALTVPRMVVREVADRVIGLGVRGIWNFAHLDLDVPPEVSVENVHLSDSLMRLSYLIQASDKKENES